MSFALLNKRAAAGTFWASFPIPTAWAPWNYRNITSKSSCMRFLSIIGNRKWRSFEKVYLTGEEEQNGGFVIGEQRLVNRRLRFGGNTEMEVQHQWRQRRDGGQRIVVAATVVGRETKEWCDSDRRCNTKRVRGGGQRL